MACALRQLSPVFVKVTAPGSVRRSGRGAGVHRAAVPSGGGHRTRGMYHTVLPQFTGYTRTGPRFNINVASCYLANIWALLMERRPVGRLFCNMGLPIPARWRLYIETGPWAVCHNFILHHLTYSLCITAMATLIHFNRFFYPMAAYIHYTYWPPAP